MIKASCSKMSEKLKNGIKISACQMVLKISDQNNILHQRTLRQNRFKSVSSAEHCKITGHELDSGNVKVLCREEKLIPRKVKAAIFIKKKPSLTLNRNGGRELSKIYDSLLASFSSVRSPPTSRSKGTSVTQLPPYTLHVLTKSSRTA